MIQPKGRILVVDDDPTLLTLLVNTLTAIGYYVTEASDGVEALQHLRSNPEGTFDLLISDVKMPNMDGLALLKRMRRLYPELPVLFVTGIASEETMRAASPDGFINKPFRIGRLEELIESTLAARASGKSKLPAARRVLINIAEDSLRESFTEALSLSNYLPFAVTRSDEALEELKRGRFDVMITGTEQTAALPSQVLGQVRQDYPALAVVLVTEETETAETRGRNIGSNFDGFVTNRFSVGELISLLDRAVDQLSKRQN